MAIPPNTAIPDQDEAVKPDPIDPGEALVATTGIRPVVSGATERIGAPVVNESKRLNTEIAKLARKLVLDELGTPRAIEPYSYDALLTALTDGLNEQQLTDMTDSVRDGDLGMAYTTVAHRAVQYLQAVLPKSVYQTSVSATNLQVSDPDWWGFQEQFELLDNPLRVFDLMATGELRGSHVHCLRTVYPTIGVAIDDAIDEAIVDQVAKVKSFELPLYVDWSVATWRGDPVSPVPYQNAYAQVAQQRQNSPTPSTAKSPLAAEASTSTEQALYKSAGLKP